jgi:FkbM family methyltransferase
MTLIKRLIRGISRRVYAIGITVPQGIVRIAAAHRFSRKRLNGLYERLTFAQKRWFHRNFAKIFRDVAYQGESGIWEVEFIGKRIALPLRKERFWLDWDSAVSMLGNDIEVKETYGSLILSDCPPDLFIDIGANFGTHSLLFLVHGINTISFEPNSACHTYLKDVCNIHGLVPHIEAVALGDCEAEVDFFYPERDTWFGTTDISTRKRLEEHHTLVTYKVRQKTLDEYLMNSEACRILIKVDAEGSEYRVLQGGLKTLRNKQPFIIFESVDRKTRQELFDFLEAENYTITQLPWDVRRSLSSLSLTTFLGNRATNFMAIPCKRNVDPAAELHI